MRTRLARSREAEVANRDENRLCRDESVSRRREQADAASGQAGIEAYSISQACLRAFGAEVKSSGERQSKLTLPLRDPSGRLRGRLTCSVGEPGFEQYEIAGGPSLTDHVFNLDRAAPCGAEEVIVVEGVLDCMKVEQAGFPPVVALLGASMSEAQEKQLVERFDRIVLAFAGDEAGWRATLDCAQRLVCQVFVKALVLPPNTRPCELPLWDLSAMLKRR
jgi:hypothetical protein